LKTWQSLRA